MKKKVVALLGLGLLPISSVYAEEAKNVEANTLTTIEEKPANLKEVGENKLTKEIPQYKEVKEETKELKPETKETKTTKEKVEKTAQVQKEKLVVGKNIELKEGKYYKNSTLITKEWIFNEKEGAWYYLFETGEVVKNAWVGDYYLGQDGKMLSNQWLYDSFYKGWYYLTNSGAYANATWIGDYYLKQYGKMADAEWIYDPNYQSWYYLNNGGSYARSQWEGNYYLYADGKMATKAWVDSEKYYVDENGKWVEYVKPLNTPWYFQRDPRWSSEILKGITMAVSGCVPTSLSMIFNGFGENTTPIEVARWIIENTESMNTNGYVGTRAKGSAAALKAWGFDYKVINTKEDVKQALVEGKTILACVGQGHFVRAADGAHAIVLSGYQDGKTFVRDPENNGNSKWFDIDFLWNQRSFDEGDIELGGPFMVVEKVATKK